MIVSEIILACVICTADNFTNCDVYTVR